MGFEHNNCAGACVKAGQAQWRLLLEKNPELYRSWEDHEQGMRKMLQADIAILRDRRGGQTRPLTLLELRTRESYDKDDWGGCGCFSDAEEVLS